VFFHKSVLFQEALEGLDIKPGEKYIDATLGGGGHTKGILDAGAIVLGIDQDSKAREFVVSLLGEYQNLTVKEGNFRDIETIAEGEFQKVSGILFDLGVSSYQLDTQGRGFSIKRDEKLDMRMNTGQELSAYEVVNTYTQEELSDIFIRYGEEEKGLEVAKKIVEERRKGEITTTGRLVEVIEAVVRRSGKVHPATKIFQALRIEVNDEIRALKEGLSGAISLLVPEGRIAVISFHSLEDRIIKRTFDDWEKKGLGQVVTKKPVTAGLDEVRSNSRARSAKLRIFKKT